MINIDLSGKHAVVTGGSAGIGAATARTLAEAGASVTVLARRREHESEHDLYTDWIGFHPLDVTDSSAVTAAIEAIDAQTPIDIAVLNAGYLASGMITETDDDAWRQTMAVNVDGLFYCARAVLRRMVAAKRPGKLITVGSISGFVGNPRFSAYCASKGMVANFTRQAATDFAPMGININSVAPGFVETPMTSLYDAATRQYLCDLTPNGKWATPQEIANVVLFLASNLASQIHGETITVDGGWLAGVKLSPPGA